MLHTGSDALGAYLGRLYAFRKKTGIKQQFQFYRRKIRYLLLQPPLRSMLERISYYFMPGSFRFINPDTPEGKRVILAVNSGANFGFANRIAIINAVNSALKHISGENSCEARLLYDCSHNSIYKEMINGNKVWAHRHNACRAYPPSLLEGHPVFASTGQPIILPGTNQTSSFICAAKEGAAASHYTVDHGLGAIQKRHEESESLRQIGDHSYLFKYDKDMPEMVPIMTDDAVKEAVEILNQADIIQTVARLKPLATLKGPKSRVM
jgi:RNA-splicing ligase RtcB